MLCGVSPCRLPPYNKTVHTGLVYISHVNLYSGYALNNTSHFFSSSKFTTCIINHGALIQYSNYEVSYLIIWFNGLTPFREVIGLSFWLNIYSFLTRIQVYQLPISTPRNLTPSMLCAICVLNSFTLSLSSHYKVIATRTRIFPTQTLQLHKIRISSHRVRLGVLVERVCILMSFLIAP